MSLNIDANNINRINSKDSQSSIHTNLSSSSENVSVFQKNEEFINQLCQRLQIKKEQLNGLLELYPDFYSFDPAKQAEIVKNNATIPNLNNGVDVDVNATQNNTLSSDDTQNVENINNTENTETTLFNHKEFSNYSMKEKVNVYALEVAKNKFLYQEDNTTKSIEDWNSLSEAERNKLVKNELDKLIKDNSKNLYDEKSINNYFDNKMTKLQTANYLEQNIDVFDKQDSRYIATSIHDYLFSQDEENLSNTQKAYIENQYVLSKAVLKACKDKGDTSITDIDSYNLAEDEIAERFDKNGLLSDTTRLEVQMKYLQDKVNKGIQLDETEQNVYNRITKLVNTEEGQAFLQAVKYRSSHPNEQVNFGRLDELMKSEFGEDFKTAVNNEDKAFVVKAYINKKSENLSSEEKAKLINELTIELMNNNSNAELITDVHEDAVENSDDKTQSILATSSEVGLAELNAMHANKYNKAGLINLSNTHENMLNEDPKRAEMLARATMKNLSDDKFRNVSAVYAASKSEEIEKAQVDRAYNIDTSTIEGVKIQKEALEDTNNLSTLEVRKIAGQRLDESHKDIQLSLTDQYSQDKEVAKAMNKNGTITRYHKDNIASASHMLRVRFEQDDFSKDEAISQLNILADNITKVKDGNVQLDMHNDIMQSKYSEVQEHAAGNIKDYDPTVQKQAFETVLASGNEKAIESAVESVKYAPDCVKTEIAEVIEAYATEKAFQSDDKLVSALVGDNVDSQTKAIKEKIASGQILSDSELSTLSVSERREYFTSFFKKLPVEKKIKLLASMPDSQKKTVYTLIARTDSTLFNAIIKDKDRADQLLSMGLPEDVNNKIKGVVSFLAISDIGYQNIAAKYDIEYDDGNREIKNKAYSTTPQDFDTKEIYKRDKFGNILT